MTPPSLQQHLDDWRLAAGVPLVAAAVRLDDRLLWSAVSTDAPPDIGAPRPPLRFPIYSITKTFTAVCVLRLEAAGVVRTDDPIARWVAGAGVPEAITLSHLLRHTSGLRDYGALAEYQHAVATSPSTPWTDEQFIDAGVRQGLLFEPGDGWSYSNVGYLLLKMAIERATDQPFRVCVERHVSAQLDLADTFVAEGVDDWRSCVPGYGGEVRRDGEVVDVRPLYHPGWCAPGVAISTPEDVTRFYDGLFAGSLIEPSLLAQMLRLVRVPGAHPPAVSPSYGMGIAADPDGPFGPSYGHGGAGPGYNVSATILPRSASKRLSIAVCCNSSTGGSADECEGALLRAILLPA